MELERFLNEQELDEEEPGDKEATSESEKYKPRGYQYEMLQYIIKENTIVYLPTGSGKTYIAILAMRHFGKQLELPICEGGKRTIFLVNTVVLVSQQAKYIEKLLPYTVAGYSGDMNVDRWKKEKWLEEFEQNQILVSTTQIILDVVRAGFLKISNINLMVFDECHHAIGEHPMHQLMSQFENVPKHHQPRVVGLTGMLISGSITKEQVVPRIELLENTFNAVIRTVNTHENLVDVLVYSTKAIESVIVYQPDPSTNFHDKIKLLTLKYTKLIDEWPIELKSTHVLIDETTSGKDRRGNPIKKIKSVIGDFLVQLDELGLFGGFIAVLGVIVELELKRREAQSTSHKNLIRALITGMELIAHLLNEEMGDLKTAYEKVLYYCSPKVKKLFVYLEEYLQTNFDEEMKCIIFTHRRHTAKVLYHILKLYALENPLFKLKTDFMVGNRNNIPETIEAILETKWSRRCMERFRKNEINCIVATSVLEEGVDLQTCNLVISFDFPHTFRSYIQSKGRARKDTSNYVAMIPKLQEAELIDKIRSYKEIDEELKKYLVGKTIDRKQPLKEDVENELFQHDIKPFFSKSGAKLEVISAMSLLNRYCNCLPHDEFSFPTITWIATMWSPHTNSNLRVVDIKLPLQSIYKTDIRGLPSASLKMAKRYAAFNACKILYEKGELNERLLPITPTNRISELTDKYFKLWAKYPEDNHPDRVRSVGTKKITRLYPISYPKQLNGCCPNDYERCNLYKIQIKSVNLFQCKDEEFDGNNICKQLLMNNQTYAICTKEPLPKLSGFKLYLSFCDIDIEISDTPIEAVFKSENDMNLIRRYHIMTFKNLLHVTKTFLVLNHANNFNSYMIVPMIGDEIDWKLIMEFQNLKRPREPTMAERKKTDFNRNDYLYKIVTPWYRPLTDNEFRYIVTNVREDLSPSSAFPNDDYDSYASYFNLRYNLCVTNSEQFLINVKGLTSKLNRLHPIEDKVKNKKSSFVTETLIPEFCYNFMYPGSMWMKAILLPTILHRLHFMLNAENLRVELNRCVIRPDEEEDDNYLPENLDVDKTNSVDENDKMGVKQNPSNIAILLPNPHNVEASKIKPSDYLSLSDILDTPWNVIDEPIDLERNLDVIHSIDIDFYHKFVSKKLEELTLHDELDEIYSNNPSGSREHGSNSDGNLIDMKSLDSPLKAICDKTERSKINLLEINKRKSIQLKNLIKAITTSSSADVFDMERYELLGDSYLKFITSIYLYFSYPDWHEGFLTKVRGQIISNRNLLYCGIEKGLPEILKVLPFSPKNDWIPPLFTVPTDIMQYMADLEIPSCYLYKLDISIDEMFRGAIDKMTLENFLTSIMAETEINDDSSPLNNFLKKQYIRDKTISDCVESILGVCVENFGIKNSIKFINYFNIIPHNIDNIFDTAILSPRIDKKTTDADIADQLLNYREVEKLLGYQYKDHAFLLQALTHTSYLSNRLTRTYQQLEFLGDAILDFLITSYIYENGGNLSPGELTDIRSALVNNTTLACIVVRNKLHRYMLYQNAQLSEAIKNFYDYQAVHHFKVTDQVELLNTEGDMHIADFIDVPKCLGDIFESIVGSIYLDCNKNLNLVWDVIYNLMKNEIHEFMVNVPKQIVRRLYEFPKANPTFGDTTILENGQVMINVSFTKLDKIYEATGFGQNKHEAKKAAAKYALQILINQ